MTNTKTCPICTKAVDAARLAKHPSARTCGGRACAKEHRRRMVNKHKAKYLARRNASDPTFRERELQRRRDRYDLDRVRAGKPPTVREAVAPDLTASGTFLSAIRQSVTGALRWAAWAFGVDRRRRRAAAKRWAQTTGHAYAQTAEQVAWADHLERLSRPLTAAERANRAD